MIDFIKLNISHISKSKLLNNPLLKWNDHYIYRNDGKIINWKSSDFGNLSFTIYPSAKRVAGSLHSFHRILKTGERQNYDDFHYSELLEVIQYLVDNFDIDPNKAQIENLEYGVNVNTVYSPKKIIQNHLIMWDCKENNSDLNFDRKGKYKKWSLSHYDIKCYDKSLHFNISDNIMRFEKRARKSIVIKKFGFKYLNDLRDLTKLVLLKNDLLAQYDKLLILDTIIPDQRFNDVELSTFNQGINPMTWYQFKERNRMAKKRFKSKFNATIGNYNLDQIKQSVRKDIECKFDKILCTDFRACQILSINTQNDNKTLIKRHNNVTVLPLDKESKRNKPCNQAISDIYHLHHDDPRRKRMRNNKSNPRNNLRKSILKIIPNEGNIQSLLFPLESVIQLSDDQIKVLDFWRGTKWDILGQIGL